MQTRGSLLVDRVDIHDLLTQKELERLDTTRFTRPMQHRGTGSADVARGLEVQLLLAVLVEQPLQLGHVAGLDVDDHLDDVDLILGRFNVHWVVSVDG